MTVDIVITNSHITTPDGIIHKNLIIDDGKIINITTDMPNCSKIIDAKDKIVIPGMIDTHVHYGVYSPIEKAALSESYAGAIGGVCTMMRMLRLEGSFKQLLKPHIKTSAKTHYVDYAIHASIFNQTQIEEMDYCIKNGILSFKLYMNLGGEVGHVYMDQQPYADSLYESKVHTSLDIVKETIKKAAQLNCPVLIHAEDFESCACGIKTAKEKNLDGLEAWSSSRSPQYEVKAIKIASELARRYDCIIYFVHIGSALALEQITAERQKGTKIHVETCPHYLTLSFERQKGYLAKVMPPIRTSYDKDVIWNSLSTKIDTIGTDHVANRLKLKLDGNNVWDALAGFPGIGTALPLLLDHGINQNKITIPQLVNLTSTNAAKIFGMYPAKGTIQKGSDADLIIIDLKLEKKVTSELFGSYSDYTVYEGMKLKGWPIKTILRGKVITDDFKVIGRAGFGRLVPRKVIV